MATRHVHRLRRAPLLLAAIVGAAVLFTSCRNRSDWVQFRGSQGSGSTPNSVYPPLAVKWKLKLQAAGEKAYAFNNPVVKDDTIYFGSTDGNFYALDIATGYMKWVFKSQGSINSVPFADADKVYFGSNDGTAYALWRKDGKQAWSYYTGRTIQSTVIGYEADSQESILFISDGGAAYVFSRDGALVHQIPNPTWFNFSFQVYDDVMYFAPGPPDRPQSFGAYDLKTKSYLFVLDTERFQATWYSFPALRGSRLFFSTVDLAAADGSGNGTLLLNYYAFDRKTGEELWRHTEFANWGTRFPVDPVALFDRNIQLLDYLAPSLWRNLVIYTSGDAVVRAFDARTGSPAWTRTLDYPVSAAPAVAGDRLYFGMSGDVSRPPRLVALSARNGRTLWEMPTEGELLSAPLVAGKYLIFGTDEHVFYVLEEIF
jgi:outer membrane protein assembly factor BamB